MRKLLGLFVTCSLVFALSFTGTGCGKKKEAKDKEKVAAKEKGKEKDPKVKDPEMEMHTGTFVSAENAKSFKMETDGKEHEHTLADDAKVWDMDKKEIKLTDIKKGQEIMVTTEKGDLETAHEVKVTGKAPVPEKKKEEADPKKKDEVDPKKKDEADPKKDDSSRLELQRPGMVGVELTRVFNIRSAEFVLRRDSRIG